MKTHQLIQVEQAESELMQTGADLASMVIAAPKDRKTKKAQAQLYLARRREAERLRLEFTIEYVNQAAADIDAIIPDA